HQQPDAAYLRQRYDARRTSLSGLGADLSVNKEGGNANWGFALSTTSPGFEVNDLGFQRRTDRAAGDLFVGYRWTKPGRMFRQASIGFDPLAFAWNYGGERIQLGRDVNVFGQLLNYWSGNFFVYQQQQGVDDRLTRGGPAALAPAQWSAGATITSDTRQPVNGTLNAQYFHDAGGTWSITVSPVINVRPSAAVSLQFGPSYVKGFGGAQYVTTHADAAATTTYGARYIFGELTQRQLDLTTRLNVTFTPTVSFQLYVQPFTFSGRYATFKELAAPYTYAFSVYGQGTNPPITYDSASAIYTVHPAGLGSTQDTIQFSNPDSRIRSLRSNAVLRWEYRPGSTLFLVWSQSRFTNVLEPPLDLGHYVAHEIFLDPPTNVLLVKLNYWLSLYPPSFFPLPLLSFPHALLELAPPFRGGGRWPYCARPGLGRRRGGGGARWGARSGHDVGCDRRPRRRSVQRAAVARVSSTPRPRSRAVSAWPRTGRSRHGRRGLGRHGQRVGGGTALPLEGRPPGGGGRRAAGRDEYGGVARGCGPLVLGQGQQARAPRVRRVSHAAASDHRDPPRPGAVHVTGAEFTDPLESPTQCGVLLRRGLQGPCHLDLQPLEDRHAAREPTGVHRPRGAARRRQRAVPRRLHGPAR